MFEQMNSELEAFVNNYVDTFVAWDLLALYHKNPRLKDTVSQLAQRLGRKEEDVEDGVKQLTKKGILTAVQSASPLYTYDPPAELRQKIDKFVAALDVRETRLLILSLILQKGAG